MKIVILDGYTINPGDLSWQEVARLGDLEVHDQTAPGEVMPRIRDAQAVLSSKIAFDEELLASLPDLEYIGVLATGYNVIDVQAAARHGVTVTNVPDYSTDSVAQHVIAMLLELAVRLGVHNASVHDGDWSTSEHFCYWKTPLVELAGKTLGIIGLGAIGKRVAVIARALGMITIAHNRSPITEPDVEEVGLDELLSRSDAVSIHCPLTPETEKLIDAGALSRMKPTAWLINTARGPILDENAVAAALESSRIAGAALDVLSTEPPEPDNPLLQAPRCLITPHTAWATTESRSRLIQIVADNLLAYQQGRRENVVN
jgi:glycerate dehydrogenase